MSKELHVTLSAQLSAVNDMVPMVEEFGDANELPVPKVFAINFALEELITNTVTHGNFKQGSSPEVAIYLEIDDDVLFLTFEDNADPFDPTLDTKPDLTSSLMARELGGLGLHLIKAFADRISWEFVDGKNRLRLEHNLKPASE